jgi:hypothetical protein
MHVGRSKVPTLTVSERIAAVRFPAAAITWRARRSVAIQFSAIAVEVLHLLGIAIRSVKPPYLVD